MDDLCDAIVRAVEPSALTGSFDLAGPQRLSLIEVVQRYRAWLGLPSAPVVRVPIWLAAAVIAAGDLAARLGWSSPLRSTALRQMDHDVEGDPTQARTFGVTALSLDACLSGHPASVQDIWHARLWPVRPLAVVVLSLFWTLSGLITLWPGWDRAVGVLREGEFGGWSSAIAGGGAVLDIALGLALLVRGWTAGVAVLMALTTLGYLLAGTLALPHYWLDPLGPWLKTLPMVVLCFFVAATDARR